jgi:hypothetical protein
MTVLAASDLQELAAVRDDEGCAITAYLNLDPSVTPTPAAFQARANALLNEGRRRVPAGTSHDARVGFDAALRRTEALLADRSRISGKGTQGIGIFAHGQDVFELRQLTTPVEDRFCVGHRLALLPLAASASRAAELMLLLVSTEEGRLLHLRDGDLSVAFDDRERGERRHDQGGWEQADLQRWHDQAAAAHVRSVVEHAEEAHAHAGRPPVVLAATGETAAVARSAMTQELAAAVVAQIGNERDAGTDRLLEQGRGVLRDLDARKEDELLGRWRTQVGRDGGRATRSADEALTAICDARAEWLLVSRRELATIYECTQCGRLAATPGQCPVDGAPMRRSSDGIEAAVGQTLAYGGSVWRLSDVDRDDLDGSGGIAAITRF